MALDELARESAICRCGSSTGRVFQNRFPKARRFAQAHAPRDYSLVNALAEMLAHVRHNLPAQIGPTIEHRHNNAGDFKTPIRA
jgi:hypothetical protein